MLSVHRWTNQLTSKLVLADLPASEPSCPQDHSSDLHGYRSEFGISQTPHTGAGMLTCYPSTTAFALALGTG